MEEDEKSYMQTIAKQVITYGIDVSHDREFVMNYFQGKVKYDSTVKENKVYQKFCVDVQMKSHANASLFVC